MSNVKSNQHVRDSFSVCTLGVSWSLLLMAHGCAAPSSGAAVPLSPEPSPQTLKTAMAMGQALPVDSQPSLNEEMQARMEKERAEIRNALRNQPERLAKVEGMHLVKSERLRPRPDGNYDLTIYKKEGPTTVVTLGEWFAVSELARSLREAPTQKNRLELYRQLRSALPSEQIARLNLPEPSQAQALSAEALGELLDRISSDEQIQHLATKTSRASSLALSCDLEEGAGPMGDGAASCSHDPSGIFANVPFAMRDNQTCVKDQGNRGTCVAFAIAGGIETSASLQYGRTINLSEQDLYRFAKWSSGAGPYGDGLSTGDAASAATSYTFAFEGEWTYNPSWYRVDTGTAYYNSCVGYTGPYCSDSNTQADIKCFPFGGCYYWDSAPKSSGFTVATAAECGTDAGARNVVKTYLRTATAPILLSFNVTWSFKEPSNGIVSYHPGEDLLGGHAIQLVGYVYNDELPAGVPYADGGGYFIARNSWGCGFGDGGYAYLPDS